MKKFFLLFLFPLSLLAQTGTKLETLSAAGGTINLDWNTPLHKKITPTNNVTFTMSNRPSNAGYIKEMIVDFIQSGSYTVTHPTNIYAQTALYTPTIGTTNTFVYRWNGSSINLEQYPEQSTGTNKVVKSGAPVFDSPPTGTYVAYGIACSDETTALTSGTSKATFRIPHAMTVTAVRATLTTAQASGSIFTVDINESGTTILSTKLTIDNTEKTSTTAATPPVISDTALADDSEITIDIDQVGASGATGLKVWIIGTKQ